MMDKLPREVAHMCIWIVKEYDKLCREYKQARRDVVDAGGENYVTYEARIVVDGKMRKEERRAYMPRSMSDGRGIERIEAKLEAIENRPSTRRMRAVEHALHAAGADLPAGMRKRLKKAIMLNCQDRNSFPYWKCEIPGISSKEFYRRKSDFLTDIAVSLGLF